jgi:hypothetical protein
MNRNDLRKLVRVRLKEARILLIEKCFDGAYYLCGYAVECAIKACIAKKTRRHDFPDKKKVLESYSHKLHDLIGVAGLKLDLEAILSADAIFSLNWTIAKDWTEESRYERHTEKKARDLYRAVTDRKHGVLRWIRIYW